ncbi:MAG: hypothetical protein NT028_03370 [candidate division Zixibacteria bacterium]|jgi:hypothetical protein|nr:hypothetical protein [candidate division Zixibacteria bacterium]
MTLHDRLLALDRRWVFAVLTLFVITPLFIKFSVPVTPVKEVREIYDFIEGLKPGDYILLSLDYDPGSLAELHPVAYAMLEQCFAKRLKVITLTLSQTGAQMVEEAVKDVADSCKLYHGFTPERGIDYVYLGYKPYPGLIILGMGMNFRIPFPQDYYGTTLDSIPMMRGIKNYDNVKAVINLSAGNVSDYWVADGNARYGVKLALAMTGVMAADYYPYYQSRQIFGIIGGMKGAAEYEKLCKNPGTAAEAMKIQVFAHVVIIIFIIIGNLAYFLGRRKTAPTQESR